MKVLAIISSLRKQNTYNTIKKIEAVHHDVCSCEYEYLFLKEFNLKPCIGCHLCITRGETFCPLADDRDIIVAKIKASDAVILASPNHTMNVNWLMKNYIDRFSYLMHRPAYFNQRFMILITSGSYMGVKQAINALSPITSGAKIVSKLGVLNSPGMNEKKINKQSMAIVKEAKRFSKLLNKPLNEKPSVSFLIWFSVFKSTSVQSINDFPADYDYYKEKEYFTDVKLKAYQRKIIEIFVVFFGFLIKKGFI